MKQAVFTGVATALVTPFTPDGRVDHGQFERLVERQIQAGVNALVVSGTTGESATLSDEEQAALCRRAVMLAAGRVPVIAGAGSNNTAHALLLARQAADAGADALLVVTPYYNKTSQEGLYRHYAALAKAVPLPLLLYNIPSRTGMEISLRTLRQLANLAPVAGLKEADGDLGRLGHLSLMLGDRLPLYAGNDAEALAFAAYGGKGVVSVASNLVPELVCRLWQCWESGDAKAALNAQKALLPLCDALFCDVNPVPVKYAMGRTGFPVGGCRMPLCGLPDEKKELIDKILVKMRLI